MQQKSESEIAESSVEASCKKAADLAAEEEDSDIGVIDIDHMQSLLSSLSVSENASKQKSGQSVIKRSRDDFESSHQSEESIPP